MTGRRRSKLTLILLLATAGGGLALWWSRPAADAPAGAPASPTGDSGDAPTLLPLPSRATARPKVPQPSPLESIEVAGRVVHDDQAAADAAEIVMLRDGGIVARGLTAADGSFRLRCAGWTSGQPPSFVRLREGVVLARRPGRVALRPLSGLPVVGGVVEVGVLVLDAPRVLRVAVRRERRAEPGAAVLVGVRPAAGDPPAYGGGEREPWPPVAFVGTTDLHGTASFDELPSGDVLVVARAVDGWTGRACRRSIERVVEVALAPPRDVRVQVVTAEAATPVSGCPLLGWDGERDLALDAAATPTDADGRAWLRGVPPWADLRVAVRLPDGIWPPEASHPDARVPDAASEFRLVVPTSARVSWPLAILDGPALSEGEVLSLGGSAEFDDLAGWVRGRSAQVVGDRLACELRSVRPFETVARVSDGRIAFLEFRPRRSTGPFDAQEPVHVGAPRRLVVRVVEREGRTAAEGVGLAVRTVAGTLAAEPRRSGASGLVEFVGLPPSALEVTAALNPGAVDVARWGVFAAEPHPVDLRSGDAELEVVVPPSTRVVVPIVDLGQPGVPPGAQFLARVAPEGDTWLAVGPPTWLDGSPVLSFAVRTADGAGPSTGGPVFAIQGVAPGRAVAETVLRSDQGRWSGALSFEPACRLSFETRPSSLRAGVRLERWEQARGWVRRPDGVAPAVDDEPWPIFRRLPPGRYRVLETRGHVSSREVELDAANSRAHLVFDLRAAGWVHGRVELPPHVDPAGLVVGIDGETPPGTFVPPRVTGTTFRVLVPGDRPVILRASHPACDASRTGASIEVAEPPSTDVVLRLSPKE